ncbi:hypothetical protein [Psychrosphaera aestuarii]|uniref:hypothetical protein n=1 Tax=Psychrosphaera aestuarii TaxID=1266052 RepID=UPI001B342A2B|nr:hypothetical protein [Psychrosphaera aestuarii]
MKKILLVFCTLYMNFANANCEVPIDYLSLTCEQYKDVENKQCSVPKRKADSLVEKLEEGKVSNLMKEEFFESLKNNVKKCLRNCESELFYGGCNKYAKKYFDPKQKG